MLFDSWQFICVFLPLTLAFFYFTKNLKGQFWSSLCLVVASCFFYAWWDYTYLLLLAFSVLFNYQIGLRVRANKRLLIFGICTNLALLIYFKYTTFVLNNVNELGFEFSVPNIVLPLAISFFTFQQIAYLVDSYKKLVTDHSFLNYCLFVTFFPQLIAGPIVHHKEMMPQFAQNKPFDGQLFLFGFVLFAIGLFKKVIVADGVAQYANPVFNAADAGQQIEFAEAWGGALAYTFQLYFDFSGYADMAIGIAALFGILIPLNFNSPYKSLNIIDFWRRWHITLGRFLRDYLYIALGGNRLGELKKFQNLFLTMLLGGIWHGAGWNFAIWGVLHGTYLCVNHMWLKYRPSQLLEYTRLYNTLAWGLTFVAVVVAWVFFRAETYHGAISILTSMFDFSNISTYEYVESYSSEPIYKYFDSIYGWYWLSMCALIAIALPNSTTISKYVSTHISASLRLFLVAFVATFILFLVTISTSSEYNEFIYFNF